MTIWRLVLKEISHRKIGAAATAASVGVAVASVVAALTVLKAHDLRTQQILEAREALTRSNMARLEDDMRKAMLNLGFNIAILPAGQSVGDWHAEDGGGNFMPEEYVQRLAKSNVVTVRHVLPVLQQRIGWPERRRTIVLVGTRGEIPGEKKPMVQPVRPGEIVLGYELHDSLGLKAGDGLILMGREFSVGKCHAMRGDKDDITAWIELATAQELLGRRGQINAILALECACAWADLPRVREEITRILPETQVVERGGEALARAEAHRMVAREAEAALTRERAGRSQLRSERERLASILVPLVVLVCTAWVGLSAYGNARQRRREIGVLRAIGLRGRRIMLLFLSKALVLGTIGGALGCVAGYLAGLRVGVALDAGRPGAEANPAFDALPAVVALFGAPILAAVASWIPAMLAAQQDPAVVLRED